MIQPDYNQDCSVLQNFTHRLKTENDPKRIEVAEAPSIRSLSYWYLALTPNRIDLYKQDPAVSDARQATERCLI